MVRHCVHGRLTLCSDAQVEESLEEAVLELRSKKREMEHIKARVEGLVRSVQQKELGRRGPNAFISDGDRGRMHHELYPR